MIRKEKITQKIYFLTGKKYLDLLDDLERMSEKGKSSLMRFLQDIEYEINKLKKNKFNLGKILGRGKKNVV